MTAFTSRDLSLLAARGVSVAEAERQIEILRHPPAAIVLDRACTRGDGIMRLAASQRDELLALGRSAAAEGRVTKFVPASGAATRMFKDLIAAASSPDRPSSGRAAQWFFEELDRFPFVDELRRVSGVAGVPADEREERALLDALLEGMGYCRKPKALIPFHRAPAVRTAFEEHLLEATACVKAADGTTRIHFTVAPDFRQEFASTLESLRPTVESAAGARLAVEFSEQHPATDMLAIDFGGNPFRDANGELLFRPGGHGALLRNLAETRGDIVVIKNIDNILPHEANGEVVRWKHMLIGLLVRLQKEVFDLLTACERDDDALVEGMRFAASRFGRAARPIDPVEDRRRFVFDALDRPIRVCGVVRNEGEPGGAPFWVAERDGTRTVQIVESAQVDASDPAQAEIFASSTHFNPVDVVCGLRSWRGEPFDLDRFVDPDAVFLSRKSHEGQTLTALERPGLWNGAMARWNTVCVDVPGSTFAPVKTVFDLLRPQHQLTRNAG